MSARFGWAALIVALAAALWGVWGLITAHYIDVGVRQERADWEGREQLRARNAAADFARGVQQGAMAAKAAVAFERSERSYADQLLKERRHAAITVIASDQPSRACADRVGDHGPEPLAAGPGDRRATEQAEPAAPGTLVSPSLTVDAVRLWNAALTGTAGLAGDPPAAGTCRADGAPAEACAADSGVTLADAWDNQAENALSCRIDRERYRQLINLLSAPEANRN